MGPHSDNPPGNHLPEGVDEAALRAAVKTSGYPLQSVVAQEIASRFQVVEEWGYTDRTTQEHCTLDIYAFCPLGDSAGPVRPRLHLLVECKRSGLPFVFFPPGVQRIPRDFPEVVGVGQFQLSVESNATRDTSPSTFFCAAELPFVTKPRLAVTFAKAQRKGKEFELSGDVPFNQVVLPLASATEQFREIFHRVNGTPLIVLTICVVDAPMLIASGTPDEPSLAFEPWVRVVHQEAVQIVNHWRQRNYTIDFVHREFMGQYIAEHAVPFANTLAMRIVQYQQRYPKGRSARPEASGWNEFMVR